ncbi:putative general secretion pathway protein I; putative signal peptide [Bradyrhizobium sp. ORS 278]|uniref:type IV pilus modification PilV family protein n=1 Tax=Bradyrhizobium sp. (strain ORS 278) TaxID=114615 RepID=UPI0001507C24|nr:type II secretion system protein [Bradyrhizobium sp. ORS 278]CAL76039.1 putative general secretion pathway protein I; putative signal peptide [Bradyrhizobium sp. ORS 278]
MRPRPYPDHGSNAGFALIEALVALLVIAITLSAIGSLAATNARGVDKLKQHVGLVATVRLVGAGLPRAGEPLPQQLAGELSGHRWQMRVSRFGDMRVDQSRFVPALIELRVRSASGAMLTVETIRLQSRDGS